LKKANNVNSFDLYSNFVEKFALLKNAKEREIPNFIDVKIKNSNNIVKKKKIKKFDIQFKKILKR